MKKVVIDWLAGHQSSFLVEDGMGDAINSDAMSEAVAYSLQTNDISFIFLRKYDGNKIMLNVREIRSLEVFKVGQ